MTKPVKTTTKKDRASKYEEKLCINGSFNDLVKELITPYTPNHPKTVAQGTPNKNEKHDKK